MSVIIKRLSDLEADVEDLRRKKSFIPVLFVTECPDGTYARHDGTIFDNEAGLQQFAAEHGTVTIIIDNTRLKEE